MADPEYVLCKWKRRLWPAKILSKAGVPGKPSVANEKETSFQVEIIGLEEQTSVSCGDSEPLTEEHIQNIASKLADQGKNFSEAVEELKYRRSLKIALDILNQNDSARQVPPSEEEPSTQLSQENRTGSLSSTSLTTHQSLLTKELEFETPKKKREQKNSPSLKTDIKKQKLMHSLILEESAKAREDRTKSLEYRTSDLSNVSDLERVNCKRTESKPQTKQKNIKPRQLPKSQTKRKSSLKLEEEKSKQENKRPKGAGSPVSPANDVLKDQVHPLTEEHNPVPVSHESSTAALVRRRTNTKGQPRRTALDSCECAQDDLESRISNDGENLAKKLDGRKKMVNLKCGKKEIDVIASSCRKRKGSNGLESSPGPSKHGNLSGSFLPELTEEENKNTSHILKNKVKDFQLPDFEEDEGLESSDKSSKIGSPENISLLSTLVDEEEEEEDEELPSILSHQEPQSIEDGILVWCKLRRYPYWPAVVKKVKRKHRKANVLLIEGNTNDKTKGFSVPLRNLKHFDCEEKQDLIDRAKEAYCREIEWCIRLISDYRIRVGCHSFTGSFLEYFADDISYPVRKEGIQDLVQMPFTNVAEELEESTPETSPSKPCKKLLPDRTRAARNKANEKIVEFIVKSKGAEEHLLAILKSRKQSRWLKEFLNSSQYVTCVETYLEDEEQLDLVVNYLKQVYHEIDTRNLHRINGDGIKFISDVLLPEAIIYAISAVDDIDYKKAEEKYIKGPSVSKREREIFDEEILERKKRETELASEESK